MLLCGFLSELYPKQQLLFVIVGFLPFIVYFYAIYNKYIKNNKTVDNEYVDNKGISKNNLFYYFLGIWGLYGVAAFMPYIAKNVSYNILDLFAKNFFGVFLVYLINSKRKVSN
jgi:hypothetical protein